MVTRRQFIAGSVGVIAAGAVGGFEMFGRSDSSGNPAPSANVKTQTGELKSSHVPSPVKWRLSMPEIQPVATVFSLHGRSGDRSTTFDQLKLQNFVAAAGLPLAIAAVDGGEHSYWHKREDGTDTMSMLLDDFIPMIEQRTAAPNRALFGWSMGGYGALLAAQTRPGFFGAMTVLSPALWTKPGDSAPGAFDDAADFVAHDVFAHRDQLASTSVRVSCGQGDPFYNATKTFCEGVPGVITDFGDGAHTESYWRGVAPAALRFIASSLS